MLDLFFGDKRHFLVGLFFLSSLFGKSDGSLGVEPSLGSAAVKVEFCNCKNFFELKKLAIEKQDLGKHFSKFESKDLKEIFKNYRVLFNLFCPGAKTICSILPILPKKVAVELIDYLIDKTGSNPGFYFDKKLYDVSLLNLRQILLELEIYKKAVETLRLEKRLYLRILALEADFLFLRAGAFLFKNDKKASDFSNITKTIGLIERTLVQLRGTIYEKKYFAKLRLLKNVLVFAQNQYTQKNAVDAYF